MDLYDYKKIHYFLRGKAHLRWNVVWFDYVDRVTVLVDFLIGLNFPYSLVIEEASVKGKNGSNDVTMKCRSLVRETRGISLFLADIGKDLGIRYSFSSVLLTIKYRYDKKNQSINKHQQFRLSKGDSFVLNFLSLMK